MKIDSYASLSSVIYFLIVYFDSPNIDLLYRNLPICLGFSSIFDFVVDTPPRQNANKICFYTRLNRIFVTDKFFPLPMKLFIKNMVCPRCILVVRDILRQAGIEASSVVLGEAVLPAELTAERRKELDEALRAVGFELIDDRRKTTQKVNLYEKVQIPGYEDAIRKIKRFMEDEENLSKSAQKIVKTKQQAAGEGAML